MLVVFKTWEGKCLNVSKGSPGTGEEVKCDGIVDDDRYSGVGPLFFPLVSVQATVCTVPRRRPINVTHRQQGLVQGCPGIFGLGPGPLSDLSMLARSLNSITAASMVFVLSIKSSAMSILYPEVADATATELRY